LKLTTARGWAEQNAAIWQFLWVTKVHGDEEWFQALNPKNELLQIRQFIITTERDMRRNEGVLNWIEALPYLLDT
jgi:hypothetical protein